MGKWTLGSYDDLLRDRMKSLVMSAVKRSNLEDSEPAISYEAFVEELDVCDSFTSSLVDILVKEVADRRTRPSAVDRRLISQRTAECLRTQAGTRHVYRQHLGRFGRPIRAYTRSSLIGSSSPLSDEEDAAELESPEGYRVNTDLYDAYHPPSYDLEFGTQALWSNDRGAEIVTSPRPRPFSPPFLNPRRTSGGPSGSSLTRQNSIRRTTRSRTMDFSDFTARRRSAVRQSHERSPDPLRPEESADGTWRFSSTEDQLEQEGASLSRRGPRRFFPMTAWSDPHLRINPGDGSVGDTVIAPSQSSTVPPSGGQSSAQLWYSLTSGTGPSAPSPNSSNAPDGRAVLPRLRRGGVRAPEFLSRRFVSPPVEDPVFDIRAADGQSGPSGDINGAPSENQPGLGRDGVQPLTPRSISPSGEQ